MPPNLIIVEWEKVIKLFLSFYIYWKILKNLPNSANLGDELAFPTQLAWLSGDDRRGGGDGQTAATAVVTTSIYFHFPAQSVLAVCIRPYSLAKQIQHLHDSQLIHEVFFKIEVVAL